MARIQVNGIELEVVTGGAPDADPMVFIMGIGAQHVMWPDPLLEGVEGRGFRTIRYDNRDSGLSTSLKDAGRPPIFRWMPLALFQRPLPAPYTLWDMADDTAELMAAMGLEKAHVVGVSMGGMIAQCLALRYRERVSSLTLIMTTSGSRRHIIGKPKALAALLGKRPLTAEEAAEHTVDLFRVIGSPGFPFDEELIRDKARQSFDRGVNPAGFLRQFAAILATEDRTPQLRSLEGLPVTVLHGAADPLIPVSAGRQLAAAIPGARLEVVEGMGHSLPLALTDFYVELLAETAGRAGAAQ